MCLEQLLERVEAVFAEISCVSDDVWSDQWPGSGK